MNPKSIAKNVSRNLKFLRFKMISSIKDLLNETGLHLSSLIFNYSQNLKNPLLGEQLPYPTNWDKFLQPIPRRIFVEIGSGHGELIYGEASKPENSNSLFVGFEIATKFAKLSSKRLKDLPNAYVFKAEAYEKLFKLFKRQSLDGVYILFPDPWHKKRHHKRRPLTNEFFTKLHSMLKSEATVLFATDWEEYYDFVENQVSGLENLYIMEKGIYTPEKFGVSPTHYYKKWLKIGRKFQYILFTNKS